MIVSLFGQLKEKREQSLILEVEGIYYEIFVPSSVLARIDKIQDKDGNVCLKTYYYMQINQASGVPMLIGFISEIEREFFLQFIKVSGIGPKAAIRALNKPIAEITQAIDRGDVTYLKGLPGIGAQRAKEIIAKLQGRVGRFCLIQDEKVAIPKPVTVQDWEEEALTVLMQLQYKRQEAQMMIEKACDGSKNINSVEDLLNQIYKQKTKL